MAQDVVATCKSVTFIESLDSDNAVMSVAFDLDDEYTIMLGKYSDSLKFVDQRVVVGFRQELYKGDYVRCVNNLTVVSHITVIPKEFDIKLYADGRPDTESNVIFEDLSIGDDVSDALVYVVGQVYESSRKTDWVKFTILDKHRRVSTLRVFRPDVNYGDLRGTYVRGDMRWTKFGFNSETVSTVPSLPYTVNPEIDIAKQYILKSIESDEQLVEFCNKRNILELLTRFGEDNTCEIGYETVRVAMEIAEAQAIKNLIPEINVKLLIRAIVASRGYVSIPDAPSLSHELKNVILVSRFELGAHDTQLVAMLDPTCVINSAEREVLSKIKAIVASLSSIHNTDAFILSTDKVWGGK